MSFSTFRAKVLGDAAKRVAPPAFGTRSFTEEMLKLTFRELFKGGPPRNLRFNRDPEQD